MEYLFEVMTPLGFTVHCTHAAWQHISEDKHPPMAKRLEEVKEALLNPDEIRKSKSDCLVFLFYLASEKRYICAVAKKHDNEGHLLTAYPADKLKYGEVVWTRSV